MKINKSKLAEELGVERRTIDKYLKGFVPKRKRAKPTKINEYYETIAALLSEDSKQVFFYRRVLWKYLKDNHGLDCADSTFRSYIARTPEFNAYFDEEKRIASPKGIVRYETPPAKQTQLVGAFPHLKEIKDFDFNFQPSLIQQQILDFLTLRFIEKNENIVFLEPSGMGKRPYEKLSTV